MFVFQGCTSNGKEELAKVGECASMITMAETCLDKLIDSVEKGTVTVASLKLVEKNDKQFFKLVEMYLKNQNGSESSEKVSVQVSFKQRMSERDAFLKIRDQLEYFIALSSIFSSGMFDSRLCIL